MRTLALCLLTLCVASYATGKKLTPRPAPIPEDKTTGRIFETPAKGNTPAFFYEAKRLKEGAKILSTTTYRDPAGKVLVEETTTYENGKLLRYTYQQKQVNESGEIDFRDGKVFYKFRTPHREDADSESAEPNMIVPDMVVGVVQDHWQELMNGDTVKTRFLVLERQDSFGFKFYKDQERLIDGVPVVDFILKPSSFLIAAIAPKIRITAEKAAPHRAVEMEGVLPIRVPEISPPRQRSDYRALDGLLKFDLTKK